MTRPLVTDMFEASRSLIAGAKIIFDSEGIRDRGQAKKPALPVIVCCALAVEIGLKTLLQIGDQPVPREGGRHSLKALFEALPSQTRTHLLQFQEQFTKRSPDDAMSQLFLEEMTFVNWRYGYEHQYLFTSPAFLYDFAVALNEFVRDRFLSESSHQQR